MMAMHNSDAMQMMHQAMGLTSPPKHLMGEHQSLTSEFGHLMLMRDIELPNGDFFTLTHNVEYLGNIQASLLHSLVFGLSITLLIAVFSAVLLTHRSLRRMHVINSACQTIMSGDLSYRVPYKHSESKQDDYDQMARTINQMLDEINELVNKVKHVSDNVAHDLKSPLARLRTRLESLSAHEPSKGVTEAINEVDRLLSMINSLLGISRLEGHNRASFQKVGLHLLVTDVAEMYLPLFEEKDIEFKLSTFESEIMGDKNLLFQALANLLDNALKFTPPKGYARINMLLDGSDNIGIEINDSGPGVQDTEKVFDRFYREDTARDASGFGLGLSLVQAIVKLHGGTIKLINDKGLVVRLSFTKA
jgi:signal transduction histidine kinase